MERPGPISNRAGRQQGWQYLYPAAAAAPFLAFWSIRTRAPLATALLLGGTFFPAPSFINLYPFRYSFVANHFQYLADAGQMSEALKELEETMRLAPRSLSARSRLGFALLERGEYEKAVIQLEEALQLNARAADLHEALGLSLRKLNF